VVAGFTRWPFWRRWFGSRSEKAAAGFLRRLGYRVLAANLNEAAGEIDLLALDGSTLVVVEVRSTAGDDLDRVAASVNFPKQRKLTEAVLRFLTRRRLLGQSVRFDVLAVSWPPDVREPVFRHIPHAFEAVGRFQMFS
jgi:putative endonuclease